MFGGAPPPRIRRPNPSGILGFLAAKPFRNFTQFGSPNLSDFSDSQGAHPLRNLTFSPSQIVGFRAPKDTQNSTQNFVQNSALNFSYYRISTTSIGKLFCAEFGAEFCASERLIGHAANSVRGTPPRIRKFRKVWAPQFCGNPKGFGRQKS